MRSELFSRFDPGAEKNKEFQRDLRRALDLSDAQRDACLKALPKLRLARSSDEKEPTVKELEAITGLPRIQLGDILDLMNFFLRELMTDECKPDTPEQWSEDLRSLNLINPSDMPSFEVMARELRSEVLPQVEGDLRRRRYASGVLPAFESCDVTVELRAVQEDRYRSLTSVDDYRPTIVDLVGVLSVRIGLDAGTPSEFYFQATEQDLDSLINKFVAAKKDLGALNGFVPGRTLRERDMGGHSDQS